jgi:hypothetical protein
MSNNINRIQKVVVEVIYLFLIAFFCYTASNKMINLYSFRTNLIKTSLFSQETANVFSIFIIILEYLVVLVLLLYKKIGVLIFSVIMLIFTLYISYLKFRGLYEICGCGGILNGLSYNYHLLINISLIIISLYSFYALNIVNNEK